MSEISANRGLFRMYSTLCLIAAAAVIAVAFAVSDLPDIGIAIYLGIGVLLWAVDMVLAGGHPRQGHGLAHAVLVAAFALVWPLVVVAAVVAVAVAVAGVLRERESAPPNSL